MSNEYEPNLYSNVSLSTPEYLNQFLNTTLTGSAHKSAGISLRAFLSSLVASFIICLLQLGVFSGLRPLLKKIYQPRCYFVPNNARMEPLGTGFLSWLKPSVYCPINDYYSLGLDAYFFVRYLSILFLFFATLGVLNVCVLVPINFTGDTVNSNVEGLDRLSWSNISPEKVRRLNFHFILAIITISWFHCVLIYELKSFINIRQTFLMCPSHQVSLPSTTLLIKNVPKHLQDFAQLIQLFDIIPGGIKYVWLAYDFSKMKVLITDLKEYVDQLEEAEVSKIRHITSKIHRERLVDTDMSLICSWFHKVRTYFVQLCNPENPEILLPVFEYKNFKIRIPGISKQVPAIDWCVKKIQKYNCDSTVLKSKIIDSSSASSHSFNKVFIQFHHQIGAYMAHQCLLSKVQGQMDASIIELNPNDIIWENMTVDNTWIYSAKKYSVIILTIVIIICWVVPVSFVGLIAQLPYLTILIPFLSWLNNLPDMMRNFVSGFLPTIALTCLTETVQVIFRKLAFWKGKLTGREVELDLQKWLFGFLFVQIFLVVTISSGITVILNHLINNPSSIPTLLATNLPKASNFFFSFFVVKGLAFFGTNFLRLHDIFFQYILYPLIDKTPRQKFNRMTTLPKIRWGSIYPTYSVYASIGIVYCIISPMITIFICFVLILALIYYKYSLKFIYDYNNHSETHGQFYPIALLHLYSGIYCLEISLIGLFLLARDENGRSLFKIQGLGMMVILILTVLGHITIDKRFQKYFNFLPILNDASSDLLKLNNSTNLAVSNNSTFTSYYRSIFLHESFKYELPIIWLPKDNNGFSDREIKTLRERGIIASNKGSIIDDYTFDVYPLNAPPLSH